MPAGENAKKGKKGFQETLAKKPEPPTANPRLTFGKKKLNDAKVSFKPLILFHGTNQALTSGNILMPSSKTGIRSIWGSSAEVTSDPKLAYATPVRTWAKHYANQLAYLKRTGNSSAKVYEVEPVNPDSVEIASLGISKHSGKDLIEHRSPDGFRVIKQVFPKTGK